jgi:Ca2+-binding EF-hand superfamily protein
MLNRTYFVRIFDVVSFFVHAVQFGKNYFENGGKETIIAARAAIDEQNNTAEEDGSEVKFPTAEELEAQLEALFQQADKDGNGTLDRKEVRDLMKLFAKELNISVADLRQLTALADTNEDGFVDYHEYVPLATELLQMIYAKMKHEAATAARASRAADASTDFLLNGMNREDLEATIQQLFEEADLDKSGFLDRKEFMKALRENDLGLTKKQIRMLFDEADVNGDGKIQYSSFVPLAFSLLVEMVAKQLEYDQLPADEAAAANYLTSLFSEYDIEGSGRIPLTVLKQAFRESDIGLTTLQLRALLALATVDDDEQVTYSSFAVKAASMIAAIVNIQVDADKASKVVAARAGASALTVMGMDRHAFRDMLANSFSSIDTTGTGRGAISDIANVLGGDLGMDEKSVSALVNLGRDGGLVEGTIDLNFVADYAFDTLAQLAQLEALLTY